MSQHKRTLLGSAVAMALMAGSAVTQADGLQLTDKLTLGGFIDISTTYTDPDGGPSESSTGLDQVELNFMYTFSDKLSAVLDLEYQDDGRTTTDSNGDTTEVGARVDFEQAYFNYEIIDGLSVKAGRFLSYSGWETEDPTGLFQYSGTGYAAYFYGGYQQGVSTKYSHDIFDVAVSVVNSLGDLEGENRDSRHPAVETMFALHPVDFWTLKAFYLTDKDAAGETISMVNLWTSFNFGGFTIGLEGNSAKNSAFTDSKATGYLAMVNYAIGDFGITFRYHAWEVENDATGVTTEEMKGFTLSPSYKVSDNLLLVAEVRLDTDELTDQDTTTYALEALISF